MSNIEKTLSIIKPDAVERNLEDQIKKIFIDNGFKISKSKKIQIEKSEAEKFYKVHETKPFYNDLCSYLSLSCSFDATPKPAAFLINGSYILYQKLLGHIKVL